MADAVRFKHERNEASAVAASVAVLFGSLGGVLGNVGLIGIAVILLGVAGFAYVKFHGYPQVVITDDELIYVDLSKGPGRRIKRDDIASIHRYPKAVHFRNQDNGALLVVNRSVFSPVQLAEIARRLGVPVLETGTGSASSRKGRGQA
ncbi:MAG: hypothetical protein AB7L13_04805 [Acidimicrobiia bacterium]